MTILAHSMGAGSWQALCAASPCARNRSSEGQNVVPGIAGHRHRRVPSPVHREGPKRHACDPDIDTRQGAGGSSWLSGGVSRVGGSDLRPYAPLLDELGVSVIDTSAVATNAIRSATMPSPIVPRSCACSGGAWRGRALDGGKWRCGSDQVSAAISRARRRVCRRRQSPSSAAGTRNPEAGAFFRTAEQSRTGRFRTEPPAA